MANAAVEKMKALGLRHGEKAVVGISVTLFLVFVGLALMSKTTSLEPEALKKKAEAADSNLSAQQKVEDILAKLESAGITKSDFDTAVTKQVSSALNPADYKVAQKWVTPEPGAGLIRDQPQLIAPEDLYVFPGRGGLLMYALNDKGERVADTGADVDEKAKRKGLGRRNRGMMSGMPGMGGGGEMTPQQKEAADKAAKAEEARLKRVLAGSADKAKEKPKTKEEIEKEKAEAAAAAPQVVYKEETKGHRWVVISGTLDHKKMRDNWEAALKDPSISHPNYARLDLERQTRQADGTWSTWGPVDADANLKVLENIPEVDEELAPEDVRLAALVDPLPFLRAGYWSGVHIAHLVPKEKREVQKTGVAGGGFMGGEGMMGPGGGKGGMGMGGMPGVSGMPGMGGGMSGGMGGKGGAGMRLGGDDGEGGMMSAGMGGMGMGMGGSTGPSDDMNFDKSEQPEIMVRSLDFTVKPDATYRYRVRVVCYNPNYLRADVSPGTDTESNELKGPWSKPTEEVTVPADVAAYAMNVTGDLKRPDLATYQVIRWDPETGHTVVRNDMAAPGEIVGEYATTEIPSSEGTGTTKNKAVDFNSRQVVLDTIGGLRSVAPSLGGGNFDMPIVSLLVRSDGSVTIRSQAFDVADDVRIDMDNNYRQAIKDSNKKRQPGMMSGEGGGYGGMMMGGPGGPGGMGGMGAGLR